MVFVCPYANTTLSLFMSLTVTFEIKKCEASHLFLKMV